MFSSKFCDCQWRAFVLCALLAAWPSFGTADDMPFPARTVIHSQIETGAFEAIVQKIIDPQTEIVPDTDLTPSDYYFRLTRRLFVFDRAGAFSAESHLGGSPYVFLTVPQVAYGRSLYGIYSDLGYDAESVLRQRGARMAAFVFRYENGITLSDKRNGDLDKSRYRSFVYVPTWKNAFSLFSLLAGEVPDAGGDAFMSLRFDSESDQNLARFFPDGHQRQVAVLPYVVLRAAGGPNWQYRKLLESKMGMNAHFRGVGITENTLSPADSRKGAREFVGPNRKLKNLREYAVIDMGHMEFVEVHD